MIGRNLALLFSSQVVFTSGSVITVTVGGIVGTELAPRPALATLPVSLMVVGTALMTVPATLLMQRVGRRLGFAAASVIGVCAALCGAQGLAAGNFLLFCLGTLGIGMTMAFSQQFRFAAAESVAPERVSQAVSFILLGAIGGALVGPELASTSAQWSTGHPFRGALLALAGLHVLGCCLLLGLAPTQRIEVEADDAPVRPLAAIVRQPLFIVAVLAGVVGQGVMTFIMTATPVSMHVVDGHSMADTADVIRAHVIAMYLPSLFSGLLIARFGPLRMMFAGVIAMLTTLGFALSGHQIMHYWWALVLLGVGWNFLFVGGTTQLVRTYHPAERFRAQAVNEFSVFGTSALASLLAGTLLTLVGWTALLLTALPALGLMLLALLWARGRDPAPASAQVS